MVDMSYDIAAIIISAMLLFCLTRTKRARNLQNQVFQLLIEVNGLTAVFDVIKRILLRYGDNPSIWVLDLCTMGYFITHFAILPLLFLYSTSLIFDWKDFYRWLRLCFLIPLGLCYACLLTNPFFHWIYSFDEQGNYIRGNGLAVMYLFAVYFAIFNIFILMKYKKMFSSLRRNCSFFLLGFNLIGVIIQFVRPDLIVETCFTSFSFLMLFFVIQNPHVEMDNSTKLFNMRAFLLSTRARISHNEDFYVLEIVIENLNQVRLQTRELLMRRVAQYLNMLGRDCVAYRIENNVFCVEITNYSEIVVDQIAEDVRNRFSGVWEIENEYIKLNAKIALLQLPEEFGDLECLLSVIRDFANHPYEDKIFLNCDFDLERVKRNIGVERVLVRALEQNDFEVSYTPIFSIKKKEMYGLQCRIKMMDEDLGYIYEKDIIQVAEKSSKLADINIWIMEKVLRAYDNNRQEFSKVEKIFLPLSSALCLQFGYENHFMEMIRKYNINPSVICLLLSERTTSIAKSNLSLSMRQLKQFGVSFGLYDYGNGYTNLSSVYEMPFTYLKVDSGILNDASNNEKTRIMLQYTLQLSDELNFKTMVGGVDDEEKMKILSRMECEYGEGNYLFGSLSEEEVLRVLRELPEKGGAL